MPWPAIRATPRKKTFPYEVDIQLSSEFRLKTERGYRFWARTKSHSNSGNCGVVLFTVN